MKTRTSFAISLFVLTLAAAGCAQSPGKAPEQFAAHIKSEIARFTQIAKAAGIKAE